ncbi:gluconate 2-dehydrogenase subunit 3 family protein [Alkalimonas sp. NCh-2]|uniref:gluconate 2-dehydrogenase subunit 3 family protein n=1 Tax=Alkalimonas sp. NCh-2 TaxID=3144846 RepID=UPI0031F6ED71
MSEATTNLHRRKTLKLLGAAAASAPLLGFAANSAAVQAKTKGAEIIFSPTDPDLLNPQIHWALKLTRQELDELAALADMIIPADDKSPAASSLGAQDFINEWVSAPYPQQERDLVLVRGGIVWLNAESQRRFGQGFRQLSNQQREAICDDICYIPKAKPEHRYGARFFTKVRDLTATAYYTTTEGMADIGYIGNRPMQTFEGPSDEVLRMLKLKS